jgi:hypothetical protein
VQCHINIGYTCALHFKNTAVIDIDGNSTMWSNEKFLLFRNKNLSIYREGTFQHICRKSIDRMWLLRRAVCFNSIAEQYFDYLTFFSAEGESLLLFNSPSISSRLNFWFNRFTFTHSVFHWPRHYTYTKWSYMLALSYDRVLSNGIIFANVVRIKLWEIYGYCVSACSSYKSDQKENVYVLLFCILALISHFF